MEKIILASASPRRKELLEQAGIPFEVVVSDAQEIITQEEPGEVVKELSACKAQAVAGKYPDHIVLGADTVVVHNGKILGKPKDKEDARKMICGLQGDTHQVYTGVTLISHGKEISFYECADVCVYAMSEAEVEDYLQTQEYADKAGAYGIQGRFAIFIEGIHGDYNAIVGLPIARVYHELKKLDKSSHCENATI